MHHDALTPARLAELLHVTARTARRHCAALVDAGLLIATRVGRTFRYTPKAAAKRTVEPDTVSAIADTKRTPTGHQPDMVSALADMVSALMSELKRLAGVVARLAGDNPQTNGTYPQLADTNRTPTGHGVRNTPPHDDDDQYHIQDTNQSSSLLEELGINQNRRTRKLFNMLERDQLALYWKVRLNSKWKSLTAGLITESQRDAAPPRPFAELAAWYLSADSEQRDDFEHGVIIDGLSNDAIRAGRDIVRQIGTLAVTTDRPAAARRAPALTDVIKR